MKKVLLIFFSAYILLNFAVPAGTASAFNLFPTNKTVCQSTNSRGERSVVCATPEPGNPVARLIGAAASIIALIAGLMAVIMIILAGFQLITSGGNSEQVTKARSRLFGAIIGLIIITLAWTIIRLVTDNVLK